MFKALIISLLLMFVHITGTVSASTTSASTAVSINKMSPNSKTNLNAGTKQNPMTSLNPGISSDIKVTQSSKMTPGPETNLPSAMTPKTVRTLITKTVTNGSTILDAMFNIHFLSYVVFLLFCVYSG